MRYATQTPAPKDPAERSADEQQEHGSRERHAAPQERPERGTVGMGDATELEDADAAACRWQRRRRSSGARDRGARSDQAQQGVVRTLWAGSGSAGSLAPRGPCAGPSCLVIAAPYHRRRHGRQRHRPGRSTGGPTGAYRTQQEADLVDACPRIGDRDTGAADAEDVGRIRLTETVDQDQPRESSLARRRVIEQATEDRAEIRQQRVGVGIARPTRRAGRGRPRRHRARLQHRSRHRRRPPSARRRGWVEPGVHEREERLVGVDPCRATDRSVGLVRRARTPTNDDPPLHRREAIRPAISRQRLIGTEGHAPVSNGGRDARPRPAASAGVALTRERGQRTIEATDARPDRLPDRHRHLPLHRHRGLDAPGRAARHGRLQRRPRAARADHARALSRRPTATRSRPRVTRSSSSSGAHRRAVEAAVAAQRALAAEAVAGRSRAAGPDGAPYRRGRRARRTPTTSASTSTGRPASRPRATAARFSSRHDPER